jgi:hypothetical protein
VFKEYVEKRKPRIKTIMKNTNINGKLMTIPNLFWKSLSKIFYSWISADLILNFDNYFGIRPTLKFIDKPNIKCDLLPDDF